jgi:hypothetical protein
MNNSRTFMPTPGGPSAADLIDWWRCRAETSQTGTEHGYAAVTADVLHFLASRDQVALEQVDVHTLDVEQVLTEHAAAAWSSLAASTRRNYAGRFRRAIADFRTALDDTGKVRPIHARTRTATASAASANLHLEVVVPSAGRVRLDFDRRPSRSDLRCLHRVLLGAFAFDDAKEDSSR